MERKQGPANIPLWTFLLEGDTMNAAQTLLNHGIDPLKLKRLLIRGKRGPKSKGAKKAKAGKRGRPPKWTDESRGALLTRVEAHKRQAGGRVTDKAALEFLLSEAADDSGIRSVYARKSFINSYLKQWQNQVSIARRRLPRNPEN